MAFYAFYRRYLTDAASAGRLTGYRAPRGALRYVVETSIRLGERYRRIDLFFLFRGSHRVVTVRASIGWLRCVALIGLDSVQF